MTRSKGRRVMADSTPAHLREGYNEANGDDVSAVPTAFFNAQDGLKGRDGGPYLDQLEREEAEIYRARAEGRDPIPSGQATFASTGTQLVVAAQVDDNVYSNPSMAAAPGINSLLTQDDISGNENFADPITVVPVDQRTEAEPEEFEERPVTTSETQQTGSTQSGTVNSPSRNEDDL